MKLKNLSKNVFFTELLLYSQLWHSFHMFVLMLLGCFHNFVSSCLFAYFVNFGL